MPVVEIRCGVDGLMLGQAKHQNTSGVYGPTDISPAGMAAAVQLDLANWRPGCLMTHGGVVVGDRAPVRRQIA